LALGGNKTETIQENLTENLTDGFHQVGFRVKDNEGYWSSPMCTVFYGKSSIEPNNIEHYRSWFNEDELNITSAVVHLPSSPHTLDEVLTTGNLPEWLNHNISIQFVSFSHHFLRHKGKCTV
jgi:hypothetical protein